MHQDKVQRWDASGLSAQIGGLMHDATSLVIALGAKDKEQVKKDIAYWLHELREIADEEKKPKPLSMEQIKKMNDEFQKRYNEASITQEELENTNG
jgi:hypothetical protein